MSKEVRKKFREELARLAEEIADGGATKLQKLVQEVWADAIGGTKKEMDKDGNVVAERVEGTRGGRQTLIEYLIGKPSTMVPEAESGRSAAEKVGDLARARSRVNELVSESSDEPVVPTDDPDSEL